MHTNNKRTNTNTQTDTKSQSETTERRPETIAHAMVNVIITSLSKRTSSTSYYRYSFIIDRNRKKQMSRRTRRRRKFCVGTRPVAWELIPLVAL